MTLKGKRLGQNHSACQKKRMWSNSLNLLHPPWNNTTTSPLTRLFCFYKVNSYSVKRQREKKSASVFMTLDRRCIIIFKNVVLYPIALYSTIETGLEKSWHEPRPSLPPPLTVPFGMFLHCRYQATTCLPLANAAWATTALAYKHGASDD